MRTKLRKMIGGKVSNKMNKKIIILGFLGITIFGGLYAKRNMDTPSHLQGNTDAAVPQTTNKDDVKNGDLIFHTSLSGQSKAIQLATKSKYSHCGIIFKDGENFYVFEAIEPVQRTLLSDWIKRGKDGKYVIKRLKKADEVLTPAVLTKMKQIGDQMKGKHYDLTFEWSDEKIYCSELIWKMYQGATGLEIGKLGKLKDFDLTSKTVKKIMKKRYGNTIPLEETVISPSAVFDSELLKIVKSN
jgi:Permuted papain-like amidase enzyme, YaeF/YiiX, C92 family